MCLTTNRRWSLLWLRHRWKYFLQIHKNIEIFTNLIFDILLKHLEFKGLSHLHNENNNDDNDNIWKSRVFPTFTLRSLAQKGSLPLRTGDNIILCPEKNWAEKIYSFKSFNIEWPISFQRHQDQEHPGEKRRQLCNCRLWPCCQVPFHFSLSLSYIAIALSLSPGSRPMRLTSFHFHILSLSHTFTFTRFDSETNEIDIAPNTRVGTRRYMAPEVRDNDNKMMLNRQQKHIEII